MVSQKVREKTLTATQRVTRQTSEKLFFLQNHQTRDPKSVALMQSIQTRFTFSAFSLIIFMNDRAARPQKGDI